MVNNFVSAHIEGGLGNTTSVHVSDKCAWVSDYFIDPDKDFLAELESGLAKNPELLNGRAGAVSVAGLWVDEGKIIASSVGSAIIVSDGYALRSNAPGKTFIINSGWPILVSTIGLLNFGESLQSIYKALVNVSPEDFESLVKELGAVDNNSRLSMSVARFDPDGWSGEK